MSPESIGTISITPEAGTLKSPGMRDNGDFDFAVSTVTNIITSTTINPSVSIGLSRSLEKQVSVLLMQKVELLNTHKFL